MFCLMGNGIIVGLNEVGKRKTMYLGSGLFIRPQIYDSLCD
jgi:hypothetical protein